MNLDRFEDAAQNAFAFLPRDFGFTFEPDSIEDRRKHWWVRYLTYRGDDAFVRIELDDRDRAFNILLGPLVDGKIPPYPIFLEPEDEPLMWFPLWAILLSRDVPEPPFSFAEDARLDHELAAWAAALRTHAAAALAGDFADLAGPVRRVKQQEANERDDELVMEDRLLRYARTQFDAGRFSDVIAAYEELPEDQLAPSDRKRLEIARRRL